MTNWMLSRYSASLWLSIALLLPQVLNAQVGSSDFTDKKFTLEAYSLPRSSPIVHSYASSALLTGSGFRVYDKELILGLQVADDTANSLRFDGVFASPNGYASITTGSMNGAFEHCYSARAATHVNTDNIHEIDYLFSRCIPLPPEHPIVEVPKENCPIILDLKMNGYHLSGAPAVHFDIDGDGLPDSIAWTKAGEDDAFLCMDRNHNGVIDDGTELFGFATPLASGEPAQIGYRALAELDEPAAGGNQDGKIDSRDRMFGDLCVWIDRNRDGISQRDEIYTLDQVGVVALEYRYKTIRLVDPFGNLFRYTSRVTMRGPTGILISWPTYDVIFANQ